MPKDYWKLCNEYAPEICSDRLLKDIVDACERCFDADIDDDVWQKRHEYSELCAQLKRLNKPVALLGTGIDGCEVRRFAEYGDKLRFSSYVRSCDEEVHKIFANDKIERLDFLQGKAEEWVVIIADEFHEDSLIKQLNGMGYEEHLSCFSMWDMLYFEGIKVIKKKPVKVTKKDRLRNALHKYNALQLGIKVAAKVLGKVSNAIGKASKVLNKAAGGKGQE